MGNVGSGKGTQSELLSARVGYQVLSQGGWYREQIASGSHLGDLISEVVDNGLLMPSWFSGYVATKEMLELESEAGLVLEGGARTLGEAQAIYDVASWLKRPLQVFFLDISRDTAVARIAARSETQSREDDDKVGTRFERFEEETLPAIRFFEEKGVLTRISGEQEPDAIHEEIMSHIVK